MIRSALGKVAWVGRTASMVFGLALVLALVFGVTSMALGANGKPFLLGKYNVASAISTLVKQGPGPALKLQVGAGQPPLAVNSKARVANLNAATAGRADSAARADSATNAQNAATAGRADSAASADNATNAQNAASAGRADSAASADNATNAQNADKLDDYSANELVRAAHASSTTPIDNFNSCGYTTILSKQVTVPKDGILLVQGSLWSEMDFSSIAGQHALVQTRLVVDGVPATLVLAESMGFDKPADYDASQSPSGAVNVTAGTKTVALQARECASGMAYLFNRSLTTLFVPFGDTGNAGTLAASASGPAPPAGQQQ